MADPQGLFAALKALLARHARQLVIVHDAPDEYSLNTRKAGPNGKPMFFGAVHRRRNAIAYHLMPLYVDPALVQALSPALRRRLQGRSCFHFKSADEDTLEELDRLTRAGMASFARRGLA
jgi:hypothetical protein